MIIPKIAAKNSYGNIPVSPRDRPINDVKDNFSGYKGTLRTSMNK